MNISGKPHSAGFSLIELMIAVAIVAIIASVAYPSYVDFIRKGKRGDAKAALLQAAQKQEVFYARTASYTLDLRDLGYKNEGLNDITGGNGTVSYQIEILTETTECPITTCYGLQARPKPGTDQVKDRGIAGTISWYGLWSTGKKQYKTGDLTEDGWG